MGTNFLGSSAVQTFTNTHHSIALSYEGGAVALEPDGGVIIIAGSFAAPSEPYNGFVEGLNGSEPIDTILEAMADALPVPQVTFFVEVFDDNSVDYSLSNGAVFIDLHSPTQQGGFAQGDTLKDISQITGSFFDDVIRGSSPSDFPPDSVPIIVNGNASPAFYTLTINNPGDNFLIGGNGNDVLEGRGGADLLIGGTTTADFGFDYASYESSPAGVTVRLAGIGTDTQTAIATGGDAQGDVLLGIEGLIGSKFNDHLTGNALDNVLAGGLGNDVLDGKNGSDTVDYSSDHFYDNATSHDAPDLVEVTLGQNGADGTGFKYVQSPTNPVVFIAAGTDTLKSIENVIGTDGDDTITGNQLDNVLNGRGGNDMLDGGLGNDTLIGGPGINTAVFASHNVLVGNNPLLAGSNVITLGLDGADGSYVRSHTVFTFPVHSQIDETDILRGIQNVIGSNLSEVINGNEQANALDGAGGNDVINGGAGNDELIGGAGNDTLNGGADNDTYDFRGLGLGHDQFSDTSGTDTILIDNFKSILDAERVGNDEVVTLKDGDSFTIVNQFDRNSIENIQDATGTKVMATSLIGGNLPGIVAGSDLGETMNGNGGDDILFGNGGNDTVLGGADNDVLDGGKGNDILDGGSGNDILTGGPGHDTFVFAPVEPDGLPGGNDVITDFVHGQDKIDLTAFHISQSQLEQILDRGSTSSDHGKLDLAGWSLNDQGRDGFWGHDGHGGPGQGQAPVTVRSAGNDTVLSYDGGSIDIANVQHLHASDFIV